MNTIAITLTQEELTLLFFGLAAAVLLLFILCIVLFVKLDKQKKRYDFFMGTNRKPSYNLAITAFPKGLRKNMQSCWIW